MRTWIVVLMGVVVPALAGCASMRPHRAGYLMCPVVQQRPAELASALLFDARPGRYDPQSFAYRSDWPSTNAYYSPGQVMYYNTRFVDYQTPVFSGWPGMSGTYRIFDSYSAGVGYR